jgi:DNA-binding CsgD family transcriptional regulator
VLEGRTWLDPSVADLVVEAALHPDNGTEAPELAVLTDREREVLKLIAEGNTAPQMAKLLGISVHTANRHRANLMEKVRAHSKTELVKLAVRLRVVEA